MGNSLSGISAFVALFHMKNIDCGKLFQSVGIWGKPVKKIVWKKWAQKIIHNDLQAKKMLVDIFFAEKWQQKKTDFRQKAVENSFDKGERIFEGMKKQLTKL